MNQRKCNVRVVYSALNEVSSHDLFAKQQDKQIIQWFLSRFIYVMLTLKPSSINVVINDKE